ncbi:MAG: calcium/sodium antiporter [Microbacteriaceae bacterium]|nr:calcium/sodium antiporter [Microbacteriaceae bacterium]
MAVLIFLIGAVAVVGGAELVVRGGARIAARLGISPLIIGLTVVAIGTSAPELAVGIDAALQGNGALAVGNIAGTNTFNLLFILGLMALIRPLPLATQTLRFDLPFMIGAALLLFLMGIDGWLSTFEGILLIAGAVLFTLLTIRNARRQSQEVQAEFDEEYGVKVSRHPRAEFVLNAFFLLAGLAVIVIGADWLVDGAVEIAQLLGVSDAFIGLTVVAIGTSAPEIVTAIVATIRNERDLAVGNLLGSSVFNILLILGVTSVVPEGDIPVTPELAFIDIPVMVGATLLCIPVFLSQKLISRIEGALFLAAYAVYFGYLILLRT